MPDMVKSSREEDQRKRGEAQFYSMQQQLDELRRQLKESLARQQWFEELYRQGEGKAAKLQMDQDRLAQDVAQTLHARQIDEGRMKAQISDLAQRIESPDKQIREIRSHIQELSNALKSDRDVDSADRRQMENLQHQIRELHSAIGLAGDGQRQLRDLIHELDAAIAEVRQEALHIAELQRAEEQRLRRQSIELQEQFEALRQQFAEVAAKSQKVDDVKRQLAEHIEAVKKQITLMRSKEDNVDMELERIEKQGNEQYMLQQERLEAVRVQQEVQFGEMRQVGDQRMERYMSRFASIDERLRSIEQALSELPSRFENLERTDEKMGAEADSIEEWLVVRQLAAMETVLEEVRKRRTERAEVFNTKPAKKHPDTPGSVYNPSGLLKRVRDAKPPSRVGKGQDAGSDEI